MKPEQLAELESLKTMPYNASECIRILENQNHKDDTPLDCTMRYMREYIRIRAALAAANEQLALCAENTTAADLAQEVEFLKAEKAEALADKRALVGVCDEMQERHGDGEKLIFPLFVAKLAAERDALRDDLAKIGPVEWEFKEFEDLMLWNSCSERMAAKKRSEGVTVRAVRVVN